MKYLNIVNIKQNYYFRRIENEKGKRIQKYIVRFGRNRPTLYSPKLLTGDARTILKDKPARSVGLVVTSPPYFMLKEAPWGGSYDDYQKILNDIWKCCYDLLDNSCRLVINIGDEQTSTELYGRHKSIPIHADIITGCENIGYDYMGTIIWVKARTMRSGGGGAILGSYPYPREFLPAYNYEYILIFKKPGRGNKPNDIIKARSKVTKSDWKEWYNAIWTFPGEKKGFHSAPFPIELPERLIRVFSFMGDIVLDPFSGSGTTPLTAMRWGRKGIGIDINETYSKKAIGRIEQEKPGGKKHYDWVEEWEWK